MLIPYQGRQREGAKTIFGVRVDAGDTRHQLRLLNPAFPRKQGISVPDWPAQASGLRRPLR
jgi:hypothetical protein